MNENDDNTDDSDSGTESDDVEPPSQPVSQRPTNRRIPTIPPIQIVSNDINSTRTILNGIFELAGQNSEDTNPLNMDMIIPRAQPRLALLPTVVKQILRPEEIDKIDLQIITDNNSVEACPICYDKFVKTDLVRILPCKHRFHRLCIDKWLSEESYLCSICNGSAGTYSNINL